jgi:hypothetical protein
LKRLTVDERTGEKTKICFINQSLRPGVRRRQLPVGLAYILMATKKAGFAFDLKESGHLVDEIAYLARTGDRQDLLLI